MQKQININILIINGAKIMTIGEKIIHLRIANDISQERLAKMLNVTRQSVSKWESGASDPSTTNLMALAKLYGVAAEDLLRESRYPPPNIESQKRHCRMAVPLLYLNGENRKGNHQPLSAPEVMPST